MDTHNKLPMSETDTPKAQPKPKDEVGASDKPEPTRYGDWEVDGRCTDF